MTTGIILAFFHLFGKTPSLRHPLKIAVRYFGKIVTTLFQTSFGSTPKVTGEGTQGVAPPNGNMNRPYASAVKESKPKKYKMTVKARSALPTEEIKQLLKTKVNPGEIKVGVSSMKSLHEGVLIETDSIEEIEVLGKEIQTKCGGELETHIHRLR